MFSLRSEKTSSKTGREPTGGADQTITETSQPDSQAAAVDSGEQSGTPKRTDLETGGETPKGTDKIDGQTPEVTDPGTGGETPGGADPGTGGQTPGGTGETITETSDNQAAAAVHSDEQSGTPEGADTKTDGDPTKDEFVIRLFLLIFSRLNLGMDHSLL